MSTKRRRRFSAEEKLRIVEEGRQSGATISEACRRNQIRAANSTNGRSKLAKENNDETT